MKLLGYWQEQWVEAVFWEVSQDVMRNLEALLEGRDGDSRMCYRMWRGRSRLENMTRHERKRGRGGIVKGSCQDMHDWGEKSVREVNWAAADWDWPKRGRANSGTQLSAPKCWSAGELYSPKLFTQAGWIDVSQKYSAVHPLKPLFAALSVAHCETFYTGQELFKPRISVRAHLERDPSGRCRPPCLIEN